VRVICLVLLLSLLAACATQAQRFQAWLADFKQEAAAQGISQAVLDDAFAGMDAPSENVLALDRRQPEKTKSFPDYLGGLVTKKKIAEGKAKWQSHREMLQRIETAYGVPAPILLALWGIESNYGERQGNFSITESLATLAFDGRRSQFFREQLLDALRIMQDEHIEANDMTGSWAGAMGEIQFMPSSFLSFAVDADGDGKKDIWHNDADALASMANYLHQKGWNPEAGWGVQVQLPLGLSRDWQNMKDPRQRAGWQRLGIRLMNGADLPQNMPSSRLILPDNNPSVAFLAFSNYNVIMSWNRSTYFATSVGLLADAIGKQGEQ
jgi:membrane-bound lytic murein transglycosylase B